MGQRRRSKVGGWDGMGWRGPGVASRARLNHVRSMKRTKKPGGLSVEEPDRRGNAAPIVTKDARKEGRGRRKSGKQRTEKRPRKGSDAAGRDTEAEVPMGAAKRPVVKNGVAGARELTEREGCQVKRAVNQLPYARRRGEASFSPYLEHRIITSNILQRAIESRKQSEGGSWCCQLVIPKISKLPPQEPMPTETDSEDAGVAVKPRKSPTPVHLNRLLASLQLTEEMQNTNKHDKKIQR
ncbi:hypothetical protein BDK51DRAFT_32584 [Blyttiomyces helicus]|uniref:Uncharacterized protein n=1 Tax=Blyttiomyces helicus TaxID=388810 RepID=A0A4V1IQ25_9FUNG|nr:hypothetical protein BDK51DRAFT_32584 [Blyttiomyces helicus]|eukprot:RKO85077.1 hypothetical protein BDK51DRAFT_32584 [Blyttiomyces helicus]